MGIKTLRQKTPDPVIPGQRVFHIQDSASRPFHHATYLLPQKLTLLSPLYSSLSPLSSNFVVDFDLFIEKSATF